MAGYKIISVDTTVDVEVYLDDFDDVDLVEELEERNYVVFKKDVCYEGLDRHDIISLTNHIGEQEIGTELWEIREKLFDMMKWK